MEGINIKHIIEAVFIRNNKITGQFNQILLKNGLIYNEIYRKAPTLELVPNLVLLQFFDIEICSFYREPNTFGSIGKNAFFWTRSFLKKDTDGEN